MITKYTNVITIKNTFIARKLINRNIVFKNKFEIYKNAKYVETRIKFSILNIINDKLKRKKSKKSRKINRYITRYVEKTRQNDIILNAIENIYKYKFY